MKTILVFLITSVAFSRATFKQSAHFIMATIYGTCEAPSVSLMDEREFDRYKTVVRKIKKGSYYKRFLFKKDREDYFLNNPVFENVEINKKNNCAFSKEVVPVYAFGGAPLIDGSKIVIQSDLTKHGACKLSPGNGAICRKTHQGNDRYSALSGMDCSAFISTIFSLSGKKMYERQRYSYSRFTTRSIDDSLRRKDSCLSSPEIDVNSPIKEGDIFNVKGSHVVMVDGVGKDPLGIGKIDDVLDCDSIVSEDFDFSIIHSASHLNMGIQRTTARAYFSKARSFAINLEVIAKNICVAKLLGQKHYQIKNSSSNKFSFINSRKSQECDVQPLSLKEERCLENCNIYSF